MIKALTDLIKKNEGLRLSPYRDTKGKLTIGYGHNLDDKPISQDVAHKMLLDDITDAEYSLFNKYPRYTKLSEPRQRALLDMTFNMGIGKVKKFYKMHAAINDADFKRAAFEILNSKYLLDVGDRARHNANLMREG